jgi:type IV secretion system protein VirB4
MLQCDAIRTEAPGYPRTGAFPDPVTQVIDDERRQQFMAEEAHYESEYFLTLTYLPPVEMEQKVQGFMFEGRKSGSAYTGAQTLERFRSQLERFENVFGTLFKTERLARVKTEDDFGGLHIHDHLLRYVRRCVSGNDHPFAVPQIPVFLNDVLACEDFCGGVEPRIGQKHIRVLAIDGFPRNSSPGLLRELDSLSVEYRWNTRAVMLDAQEAEAILDKTRKKWRSKIRGWRDQVLKTESGAVNLYAAEMAGDAEQAMSVASSGDVHFAWYSSNIVCMDEDIERLNQTTRTVMKTLQHIGFSCRIETVNAVEAWRGSLPGDGYRNVRRNLLHTLNVADLLPITAVWAGQRENPSAMMPRKSPPLLYAATSGSTPFRFNLHVGDLGHAMI